MDPDGTEWFLAAEQRGNPATTIDAGREPRAWTTGNHAQVLIDGAAYLPCLRQTLETRAAAIASSWPGWRWTRIWISARASVSVDCSPPCWRAASTCVVSCGAHTRTTPRDATWSSPAW